MSELKVKPCPFCGSDDISFSAFSISDDAYALCGNCNAGIEIQVGWDEMTGKEHDEVCAMELQKVWNRRFVEQPQLNENQKLLLEDLREIKESQKDKNMLGLIWVLGQRFTTNSNIKSFTDQEILEVLQALEQEEE